MTLLKIKFVRLLFKLFERKIILIIILIIIPEINITLSLVGISFHRFIDYIFSKIITYLPYSVMHP